MELVSVVVPVYKVQEYLDRCVESLVGQTYPHLEILLIDDGSPDACPAMCDAWAARDPRIRVIHKENQGLGMARNTGIDHATGTYICFVDSDDYLAADAVEKCLRVSFRENAQVVFFGFHSVDQQGNVLQTLVPRCRKHVFTGAEVEEELLPDWIGADPVRAENRDLWVSACGMLCALGVIRQNGWRFASERRIISEDSYSMLGLFRYIHRAAVLEEALYFYRQNPVSLTKGYRQDRYLRVREYYLACLELCRRCGYSARVQRRCEVPFLSFTIGALQHEAAWREGEPVLKRIRKILQDPVLRQVLRQHRQERTTAARKILFWAMEREMPLLCWGLIRLRERFPRRG